MRLKDADELLIEVAKLINELLVQIEKFKDDASISAVSGPKIKSVHEHLRSVLEYIAHDTFELLQETHKRKGIIINRKKDAKIYFPIRQTGKDFKEAIQKDFRHLDDLYPELFTLIESIQSFKCGSKWLFNMADHTNTIKHNKLSDQEKYSNLEIGHKRGHPFIAMDTNSSVTFTNVTFNGSKLHGSITIDKGVVKGDVPEDWSIQNGNKFRIKGGNLELIKYLNDCLYNVSNFKDRFYRILMDNISS